MLLELKLKKDVLFFSKNSKQKGNERNSFFFSFEAEKKRSKIGEKNALRLFFCYRSMLWSFKIKIYSKEGIKLQTKMEQNKIRDVAVIETEKLESC